MINIELPDFETDQVLKEAAKLHCLEMSDDVTILMNPKWSRPFGMLYMAIFLRQWRSLFQTCNSMRALVLGRQLITLAIWAFFRPSLRKFI